MKTQDQATRQWVSACVIMAGFLVCSAVQDYLLALPVVNQARNRNNILTMGPANKTLPIWENLVDSTTIELTANDNTPYTWCAFRDPGVRILSTPVVVVADNHSNDRFLKATIKI